MRYAVAEYFRAGVERDVVYVGVLIAKRWYEFPRALLRPVAVRADRDPIESGTQESHRGLPQQVPGHGVIPLDSIGRAGPLWIDHHVELVGFEHRDLTDGVDERLPHRFQRRGFADADRPADHHNRLHRRPLRGDTP
ncbi:MAG TPA: hypothetical protein VHC49_24760 [Mycobacteriales bacterium]|nr:hypothetical protein [Mycobacteriales bacterium]